jgi:hypothetical protein
MDLLLERHASDIRWYGLRLLMFDSVEEMGNASPAQVQFRWILSRD